MRSRKRSVAKLGLALAAAVLGLTAITAMAAAEPADSTSPTPPPTSSEPSEPPTESSAPPASESTEPPSNEPPEPAAIDDIGVTAEFGKPLYATGETIDITLTTTNTGTEAQPLTLFFSTFGDDGIDVAGWGDSGREVVLAGGESVTHELTGVMLNPNVDTATLYVTLSGDFPIVRHEFSVPVTRRVATASGTVFHDKNGDGDLDSGEGLGGAAVTFTNKRNSSVRLDTATNANGTFSVEVTPGDYDVTVEKAGMLTVNAEAAVPESGVDGLLYRTRQELAELAVDLEFTRDTYAPTDTPAARVTLTNKGDLPLTEIAAKCDHAEGGPNFTGTTESWGALAGTGITIAPHTTTVVEVTEPMPAAARNHGYVQVDCSFSYNGTWNSRSPRDADRATVPGQYATVTGVISEPGNPDDSGYRVVLTADGGGCPIIAEAVTDKNGWFSLGRVPVGRYHYYIVPPNLMWGVKSRNHGDVDVIFGQENHWFFWLGSMGMPGGITHPPDCPGNPGGPGTNPPAPQGSAGTGLAYTGASMLVPGIAGLLALLAGTGAVLVTRKRKSLNASDRGEPTP